MFLVLLRDDIQGAVNILCYHSSVIHVLHMKDWFGLQGVDVEFLESVRAQYCNGAAGSMSHCEATNLSVKHAFVFEHVVVEE